MSEQTQQAQRTIRVELELPASIQSSYHEAQRERAAYGLAMQTLSDYLVSELIQSAMTAHMKRQRRAQDSTTRPEYVRKFE